MSLQTEESTGYYVVLLERLFQSFNADNGRTISTLFLDIACQFGGAFDRWEPILQISFFSTLCLLARRRVSDSTNSNGIHIDGLTCLSSLCMDPFISRLIERLEARNPAATAAARAAQLAIGPWHLLPHKARQVFERLILSSNKSLFILKETFSIYNVVASAHLLAFLSLNMLVCNEKLPFFVAKQPLSLRLFNHR